MATIDEKVVEMKLDNAQFERGVQTSLNSLNSLNKGLQMQGATKGLTDVASATTALGQKIGQGRDSLGRFTGGLKETASEAGRTRTALQNIERGVATLANRFSALGTIATGALMNIGAQAQMAGMQFVKSFTFGPIFDGFREYETNLNSIQTILANTQAAGTTLKDVTGALDELNHYSDQTIYNFSEMAKNIGTFTAAGVDLKTATAAIKGIANLAALSGSNSERAAGAMYQLSQAISAGRVSLEDWNSVVNAGMGGTVFQRALAMNAEKLGTLKKGAVELKGAMKNVTIEGKSFRESITAKPGQESWLSSKVLTQTLAQFTGDMTDAQLAAQGFSKAQIKSIQAQAKTAQAAATEVKTLSQLFGTFKEQLGSGWAQTWQIIFGDFLEAKGMFTGVSNSIGSMLQKSSDGRNKMLKDWKDLGGRKALIDAISNAWNGLLSVLRPIRDAFREVFPATTGKQLYEMSIALRDFTKNLKMGGETANNLKRTFAGVFSVFGIGWDIVKELARTLFGLFGVAAGGSGSFLEVTARVGDFLVNLRKAIKEGDGLHKFFTGLGKVLAIPIKGLQFLAKLVSSLFEGFDAGKAADSASNAIGKLTPLQKLGELIQKVWSKVIDLMGDAWDKLEPIGNKINEFFQGFGEKIGEAFESMNFENLLGGINTGLLAGLLLILKNFLGSLTDSGPASFLEGIKESIEGVTDTLGAMQNTLRAATLLQIAIAIGVLALAMDKLSKIDADGLTRGLTAMGVMFAQLMGAMLVFEKLSGFTGFAKMPFIAASMILLAVAVNVLASAVEKLSDLNWNELAKGLVGVAALMGILVATVKLMPKGPSLILTSVGLLIMGGAIHIFASAVKKFSKLSWKEIVRGLIAMAGALLIVGAALNAVSPKSIISSAAILVVAVSLGLVADALKKFGDMSWGEILKGLVAMFGALLIMTAALLVVPPVAVLSAAAILVTAISLGIVADALKKFGDMSWGEIVKGLTSMFGALLIMSAALLVIPPTAVLGAAALLTAAISLGMVADAMKKFGDMSWGEIAKGLVMLAGSLTIIAIAVTLMIVALPGAIALVVIAAALLLLAPILKMFSEMSWGEILKGLTMLAGTFFVLGAAGLILAPVVPILLLLGAAITLIGVGILAAGAGVLLFATALTALAAAGGAATLVLVGMISAVAGTIPLVMKQIGIGIVEFAGIIEKGAPAIVNAIVAVLMALIGAIEKLIPKIVNVLYKLASKMLDTLLKYVPKMVDSGMKLLDGILRGIAKHIGRVSDSATSVIVNFINAISRNLPRITNAGANLIIKFINSLANTIRSKSGELRAAGRNLGGAIIDGMTGGLASGIGRIASKAAEIGRTAINAAKRALDSNSPSKEFYKLGTYVNDGFVKGLDGNKKKVDSAFNYLKGQLVNVYKASAKDAKEAEKQLKKLRRAGVANNQEYDRAVSKLRQARKEHKATRAAYLTLTKSLNDERSALGKLANKQDQINAKIKEGQKVLEDATKTRDDYNKSVTEQYSALPSLGSDTRLAPFIVNLRKEVEDTKKLTSGLQDLRRLGLNDELYKQIVSAGTGALPFVQQLLASGQTGVDEVNRLGKDLKSAAGDIGKTASTALYQAAVDSAAGLVKGLQNQQKAIEKQMDKIAAYMVKSIKKRLGIRSPSREFAKIGAYSVEGLAKGLEESSGVVQKSADVVGQTAIDSMRASIFKMFELVNDEVDANPTITPVLDLTGVKKNASKIGSILDGKSVTTTLTYSQAKAAYDAYQDNKASEADSDSNSGGDSYSYTQNNYSPKALSKAEIYRQTKNQLSVAKEDLASK